MIYLWIYIIGVMVAIIPIYWHEKHRVSIVMEFTALDLLACVIYALHSWVYVILYLLCEGIDFCDKCVIFEKREK